MPARATARVRSAFEGSVCQSIAVLGSLLLGLAIVVNVQLGGDSMWFWYATLLHKGVRLYADMHFVLQPLYVLETDVWMQLAGKRCLPYETLSLVHIVVFLGGLLLLLRESAWPDWQKAVLLFACFASLIRFDGYRFDDFHIVADIFYLYAMVLLLWLARCSTERRRWVLIAALGTLGGLAVTNRTTDGGMLLLASGACVFVLAKRHRLEAAVGFGGVALLVWFLIVHSTGDSWHDYWAQSVVRAGQAKGGTGNVLRGPYVALGNSLHSLATGGVKQYLSILIVLGAGFLVWRYVRASVLLVFAVELTLALGLGYARRSPGIWSQLMEGSLVNVLSFVVQPLTYGLCVWISVRAWRAWRLSRSKGLSPEGQPWDVREVIVLIPLAALLSAALSQATGTTNSTNTFAFLLVLGAVLLPSRGSDSRWSVPVLGMIALAGLSGVVHKVRTPYNWGGTEEARMFTGREWYQHPIYGPMYSGQKNLQLWEETCREINGSGAAKPGEIGLLSIPFPYGNYFCGVPPWGNYVQTWYDTVTPETVDTLMQQLSAAPPEWILYERSPSIIRAHEIEYHGGGAIRHRSLDSLLVGNVEAGKWRLVFARSFHKDGIEQKDDVELDLINTRADGASADQPKARLGSLSP
jgi:hypothetical protein